MSLRRAGPPARGGQHFLHGGLEARAAALPGKAREHLAAARLAQGAGFAGVQATPLTFGMVTIHVATKERE